MKKSIMATLMMLAFLATSAQNRLTELYTIEPGEGYPNDMPHVKSWINTTLKPFFIKNLQTSASPKEDSKFLSFNPAGGAINGIVLPKTKGIKLVLSNSTVSMQYAQEMLAYSRVNISSFNYSLKEYYLLAKDVAHITTSEMIANTLNFMIDYNYKGHQFSKKLDQLIDSMNNKLGTKMPYAQDHNSIQSLIDVLKQQFTGKDKIEEAIYSTFIDRKNDLQTTIQLYKFYGIVSFFEWDVIRKIDALFCPTIKWKHTQPAAIIFPSSILKLPVGDSDSTIVFHYTMAKSVLNYKKKQLEITFTGELNKKTDISSTKVVKYVSGDEKLLTRAERNAAPVNFSELLLVVSETGVNIIGTTPEYAQYEIIDEAW